MGNVVMYGSVSVDGFIADEHDQPGPLFDWLTSGDVPLGDSGVVKVSQTSYDYTRPYWDQIGVTVVGRHVFDMTNGWDGKPPATSVGRCWPRAWSTWCAWTSYPSCSGPASATSGRSTRGTCWRIPRS
jgi:hypothetical protein